MNHCIAATRRSSASLPRPIRYPRSCLFYPSVTAGALCPSFPIITCLPLTILSLTFLSITFLSLTFLSLTFLSLTFLSLTFLSLTLQSCKHISTALFQMSLPPLYTCLIQCRTSLIPRANRSAQITHALFSHWRAFAFSWILLHSINMMLYPP
jgi:hypothetical protein